MGQYGSEVFYQFLACICCRNEHRGDREWLHSVHHVWNADRNLD